MKRKDIWLVVGADGLIGHALTNHLMCAGKSVIETTRRIDTISERRVLLDLGGNISNWQPSEQISVAYLCAAESSLERCWINPLHSRRVNVQSTAAMTKMLVENGTFVIFPSTNLVFDGSIPFRKADDPVCPVTEYGRQKAEAERRILALGDMISIVRLTKVLVPNMPLLKGWIQALQNGEIIHPFSDMVMAPVSLPFIVNTLQRIAEERLPGIVQISSEKDVTYEQIARHIAQRIGAYPDLIQPVSSKEAGVHLEAMSSYSTLDMTRLCKELGIEPPEVWATIDSVFGI